ncbi:phage tail tube protein [Petroclostridium xylanilyticum]|uniref:phage tail tube protein n=1 Tax=Petroclostridium xylanilyticum TaxID=1792311 RepID=UPI000B993F9D|nr:phage tail tube protein [Petroclostridium xylanilyticum]
MSENFTRLADTLSTNEGTAYITINGQNRQLFEVMKIEANIEKTILEKRMLGNKITQHKVIGAKITGSATLALMNGDLLKATLNYLKTGVYPNIKLQLKNLDPSSTVGAREVILTGVIFNNDLLSLLDSDSEDMATFDTDFTADGIEVLSDFKLPQNYR